MSPNPWLYTDAEYRRHVADAGGKGDKCSVTYMTYSMSVRWELPSVVPMVTHVPPSDKYCKLRGAVYVPTRGGRVRTPVMVTGDGKLNSMWVWEVEYSCVSRFPSRRYVAGFAAMSAYSTPLAEEPVFQPAGA